MKLSKLLNPVHVAHQTAEHAVGLAGSAVGYAETLARGGVRAGAHLVSSGLHPGRETRRPTPRERYATEVTEESRPDREAPEPQVVLAEPHAPDLPPVDVVGEALAAEAAADYEPGGFAHEPRAASREEEHGEHPLERVEAEGIADEVEAALEGDEDPVDHLAEPLLDEAAAKAVISEMETLRKAADPHKG